MHDFLVARGGDCPREMSFWRLSVGTCCITVVDTLADGIFAETVASKACDRSMECPKIDGIVLRRADAKISRVRANPGPSYCFTKEPHPPYRVQ